ncbi:nuclear transport factor 2 family protein [Microbacterium sp. 1P10UB]|uniref:nuclear transport factor 2 family protein n=1 Tax=unclassified Microbacterium TaxID=2609290 RepID=UPI0039A394CA
MGQYLTAIEQLEIELIVRDFATTLNEGGDHEIHALLTDDVVYRASLRQCVTGRSAVVAMVRNIRSTFTEHRTELLEVAAAGRVVLTELSLHLALPTMKPQTVMSFASFRVEQNRISAWHQLHA